ADSDHRHLPSFPTRRSSDLQWAGKTLYLENRMEQTDGRGPTGNTLPAGAGNFLMQFRVGTTVTHADASTPPSASQTFYALPSTRSEEHTSELQSRGHLVCRL